MPYTIVVDEPTDDELRIIKSGTKIDRASIVTIVVLNLFFALGIGLTAGWIASFINSSLVLVFRIGGFMAGLGVMVYSVVSFCKFDANRAKRTEKDRDLNEVQVIEVEPSDVARIALMSDNEPIFMFEIDDGVILYLQGQYLYDAMVYGLEDTEIDDDPEYSVNGFDGSRAFPNTKFVIRRLANSGQVLSIRLTGNEMPYGPELDVLEREWDLPASLLINGTIASAKDTLSRANKSLERTPLQSATQL